MNGDLKILMAKIRDIANREGTESITLVKLRQDPELTIALKNNKITRDKQLVEYVLESEREMFEHIFIENNFDLNEDAVDILFLVSRKMASGFFSFSPSITHKYKEQYPVIFQKHIEKRIAFIYDKIRINLRKGIGQGLYRNDVSIELIARLFISRLIDLHDPENFPPEEFSFSTLFMQMFESFVKNIATEKGMRHFEHKLKEARKEGFGV